MLTSAPSAPGVLRHLRVEDALLFLWLVFRPLVAPDPPGGAAIPGFDPLGGLFDLVALCAAAACLVARRRDGSRTGLISNEDVGYAVGPLFGAVAFALDDCVTRLGLTGGAAAVPLVLPVVSAVAARLRLPPTTAGQRRALVTPFILAASGFFGNLLRGLTDLFDLRTLLSAITGLRPIGESLFVFGVGLLAILVFYLMLVFAPRQIADRDGTPRTWAIRYLVYIAGLSLGATLVGIVRG